MENVALRKYEVLSESIEEVIYEDAFVGAGHQEWYRIYEVVEARSHAQAKYKAWKKDQSFSHDIRDMPKFSVKLYRGECGNDFNDFVERTRWR